MEVRNGKGKEQMCRDYSGTRKRIARVLRKITVDRKQEGKSTLCLDLW